MIKIKQIVLFLGDVVLLYGVLFLTLVLRYGAIKSEDLNVHLSPFSIIFVVWLLIFYVANWYDLKIIKNKLLILENVLVTLLVCFVIAILFFYLIPYFHITPKTNLIIFTLMFALFAFLWRSIFGFFVKVPKEKVLLIGENHNSQELIDYLNNNSAIGYAVKAQIKSADENEINKIQEIIKSENINVVVVLENEKNKNYITNLLYQNLNLGIEVYSFDKFYEMILGKIPLGEIQEKWFLENITRKRRIYNILKRGIDILVAVFGVLIFFVLSFLFYPLVKFTSSGPFIFKQERIGKNGKIFILYKIRTMVEHQNHSWVSADSKLVTPVGKFLRATHLDELPQFLNVLKGDLSLVGPRPDFVEFFNRLRKEIPYYEVRTLIKPGITGWAQVNYPITTSLEETKTRLAYDLFYLKNYSFTLDILIILKTLRIVFTAAGR